MVLEFPRLVLDPRPIYPTGDKQDIRDQVDAHARGGLSLSLEDRPDALPGQPELVGNLLHRPALSSQPEDFSVTPIAFNQLFDLFLDVHNAIITQSRSLVNKYVTFRILPIDRHAINVYNISIRQGGTK